MSAEAGKSSGRVGGVLLRRRPSVGTGVAVTLGAVALSTLAVYPLREAAPVVSLGVVYLFAVLLVSTFWGLALGVIAAVTSALAFNFFHIPPTGRFTIADEQNWVALAAFLAVALAVSTIAEVARSRAQEAEARRQEADLAADLTRLLLGGPLQSALPVAAQRIAAALGSPSARLTLGEEAAADGQVVLPLRADARPIGTLSVPSGLDDATLQRLRERIVPPLETTLAAAVERDRLLAEVVETAALRRSDVIKTTLLRAVSHDLRTPLTAMVTAGEAVRDPELPPEVRDELGLLVVSEGERLSRMVDNLLDLSRLQAGTAKTRIGICSLDDVLRNAIESQPVGRERVRLNLAKDLPAVRADAAQLERAFANLIANALLHGGDGPVHVRARLQPRRIYVRVVDEGEGIPLAEQERIFEPFYRLPGSESKGGSGLGLAIARGFIEASGGTIGVESVPGQGTTFVVQLEPVAVEAEVMTT